MKPNDERKLTFEEEVELLLKSFTPVPKAKPHAPKPAAVKADERWSPKAKPLGAVLQDAQRAEAAATERLRKERSEKIAGEYRLACRQAQIDAAWQRNLDYQRELEQWRGCNRGPGDPDARWMQNWERE
jgi:hypothetical protein